MIADQAAKDVKFTVSEKNSEMAERHRQKKGVASTGQTAGNSNWLENAKKLVDEKEMKECTFQPNKGRFNLSTGKAK